MLRTISSRILDASRRLPHRTRRATVDFNAAIAKFVREYREKGFAMREIRPLLVRAFGPRILKVVQEPRPLRGKGRAAADAASKTAEKKAAAKTAGKKAKKTA